MLECWKAYVAKFRELIKAGFIVTKRDGSTLYTWVYPHTNTPHKLRMRDAYETIDYANSNTGVYGGTTYTHIAYCLHNCPVK